MKIVIKGRELDATKEDIARLKKNKIEYSVGKEKVAYPTKAGEKK